MQTRANTKAVNHWFLMLFIVLGLGTSKTAKKLNKLLAVFFFYAAKSKNCTKKMEK